MYPMATQLSSHLFNFPDTVWKICWATVLVALRSIITG